MAVHYLSPKSNFIFKQIFGDQRNADILGGFLQAVLDLPAEEYDRLTIVDPHLTPGRESDKLSILDVRLHTKSGNTIDVEIQLTNHPNLRERIVFYLARMIAGQIGEGERYSALKRSICILIADFRVVADNERYHNRYRLYDPKTGSCFTDLMEINVLEIPKLPYEEDNTALWDWMRFLEPRGKEDYEMLAERNMQIGRAVAVLKELSEDERTRLLEESYQKARWDEEIRMEAAVTEGRIEGLTEGRIEGLTEGRIEGLAEGARKVAIKMLRGNMPIQTIALMTELPVEEIERLRASLGAQGM